MAAAPGNTYAAKDRAITRAFEACFAHKSRVDQVDALFVAAMKVTENAMNGDLASFRELADRVQGKAVQQIDATEADAQLFGRLAGALIYADSARRAASAVLLNNRRGQSGLWSHGISGDSPIILLRISEPS